MKTCLECSQQIPDKAKVCGYCGTRQLADVARDSTPEALRPTAAKWAQTPPPTPSPEPASTRGPWPWVLAIVVAGALAAGAVMFVRSQIDTELGTTSLATTFAATTSETTGAAVTTVAPPTTTSTTAIGSTTTAPVVYLEPTDLPYARLDLLPYRGFHECTVVGTVTSVPEPFDVENCTGEFTFGTGPFHIVQGGAISEYVEFLLILDDEELQPDGTFGYMDPEGGEPFELTYYFFPNGLSDDHEFISVWFRRGREWVISRTTVHFE